VGRVPAEAGGAAGGGGASASLGSRLAFSGVDSARARGLSQSTFPELLAEPPRGALDLSGDARVVEWVGDNAARVRDGSRESLAVSTLPLRASTGGEGLRAVDNRIVARAGGFEAANANVRVRAGGRLQDGFGLPDADVQLVPVGAAGASPSPAVVDGRVSWVDLATDTDLWLEAIPGGLRTFHVLRSERAPERLELDLRLPAGARLEERDEGVRVLDAQGKGLAVIGRPWARDADGEPVEVSLSLEGRRVVLAVAHRGKDLQYPLAVDPPVVDYQYWYGNDDVNGPFRTWAYLSDNPAGFSGGAGTGWIDNWIYARGLFVWNRGPKWYGAGQYGQWLYSSYRESFVYRMDLRGVHHRPGGTCLYRGLANMRQNAWQSGYYSGPYNAASPVWWCGYEYSVSETHCAAAGCAWDGPVGNAAVWGIQAYGYDGWRSDFTGYVGAATVYLYDYNNPTITADVAPPSGWTRGGQFVQFRGTDPGLGMKRVRLTALDVPDWSGTVDYDTGCTFSATNRCGDTAWAYSYLNGLPEGITTLRAEGWDIIDRYGVRDSTVKIDQTGPAVQLEGSLADNASDVLVDGVYEMNIAATDPGADRTAGVASIDIELDGVPQGESPSQTDPNDNAALERDWQFDTRGRPEGDYVVDIIVTDRAGNERVRTLELTVEHVEPLPPQTLQLSASSAVRVEGASAGDRAGQSATNVGDLNDDGLDDFAIGTPAADANGRTDSGSVFVVYGPATRQDIDLAVLGPRGFRIDGAEAFDQAGTSISPAGDVNGDEIDDVVIGAPGLGSAVGTTVQGHAYVVFGSARSASLDLSRIDQEQAGFRITGPLLASIGAAPELAFGATVAGAPDRSGPAVMSTATGETMSLSARGPRPPRGVCRRAGLTSYTARPAAAPSRRARRAPASPSRAQTYGTILARASRWPGTSTATAWATSSSARRVAWRATPALRMSSSASTVPGAKWTWPSLWARRGTR